MSRAAEHVTVEHLVVACHLGDVAHTTDRHVFVAPFPCLIASARLVTTSAIEESEHDLWEVSLLRRQADDEAQLVLKSTAPEVGQEIIANTEWHFDVSPWDAQARRLPTGAVLSMRFRAQGSPGALTGVLVVLRYEPL